MKTLSMNFLRWKKYFFFFFKQSLPSLCWTILGSFADLEYSSHKILSHEIQTPYCKAVQEFLSHTRISFFRCSLSSLKVRYACQT